MNNTKDTITIPRDWVRRLKIYTNNIRKESGSHQSLLSINALLGYLDSLECLIEEEKVGKQK